MVKDDDAAAANAEQQEQLTVLCNEIADAYETTVKADRVLREKVFTAVFLISSYKEDSNFTKLITEIHVNFHDIIGK